MMANILFFSENERAGPDAWECLKTWSHMVENQLNFCKVETRLDIVPQ